MQRAAKKHANESDGGGGSGSANRRRPSATNQQSLLSTSMRKRLGKLKDAGAERENEVAEGSIKIWPGYCVNITQDGFRNMDRAHRIDPDNFESPTFEFHLRPISGLRNHIKRNTPTSLASVLSVRTAATASAAATAESPAAAATTVTTVDIMKDTDLVHRISTIKTLRRLDLSYNQMHTYPRKLCELEALEALNLTGNNLQESELPGEMERYQALIEVVLDSNKFKKLPKAITKCKRLVRLSIRNNQVVDLKHLDNLKRLRHLVLDDNAISVVDENFKSLDRLEILSLSHNLVASLPAYLFQSTLYHLRKLDASWNQLEFVTPELFMLPHIESLNLSHNQLTQLPVLPSTYFRTKAIFSVDLSSNSIARFYDYLLIVALNVDLSSNKIRMIPLKAMKKLSEYHFRTRTLKLDDNPLVDPPLENCLNGLRELNAYLVECADRVQLNKGFKVILIGDNDSGKTALAYALEDFNTQTNLIEHHFLNANKHQQTLHNNTESNFVDIHEFLFKSEEDAEEANKSTAAAPAEAPTQSSSTVGGGGGSRARAAPVKSFSSSSVMVKSEPSAAKRVAQSATVKRTRKQSRISADDLSAVANQLESSSFIAANVEKKASMNVNIYDFNGSLKQYGHIMAPFIDKSALIVLCIDASRFVPQEAGSLGSTEPAGRPSESVKSMTVTSSYSDISDALESENNLKAWLDMILLKMSKTSPYYILPVLTKCDKLVAKYGKKASNVLVDDASLELSVTYTTVGGDTNELSLSSSRPAGARATSASTNNSSALVYGGTSSGHGMVRLVASRVENVIASHINSRLDDIQDELKKIESLSEITTSQSDRLKQLIQTRANFSPEIARRLVCVSAFKSDGIAALNSTIREAVLSNGKLFPDVNKKIPTFWIDVENYACNVLSSMSFSKLNNSDEPAASKPSASQQALSSAAAGRKSVASVSAPTPQLTGPAAANTANQQNLTMLWVNYKDYKERLVDKFGMSHLIEQITKYMSSSGKIVWFDEVECLRQRIFLHPNILFDMLFVLFRENFSDNFSDNHLRILRGKLIKGSAEMSAEAMRALIADFLDKGLLRMELLKLLWFPILIIDSPQSLVEMVVLLTFYFKFGYPDVSKEKLKTLYAPFMASSTGPGGGQESSRYDPDDSVYGHQVKSAASSSLSPQQTLPFERVVVPYYLPNFDLDNQLRQLQARLAAEASSAAGVALSVGLKTAPAAHMARISQKYEFPWGLVPGLFERFTTSCMLKSELIKRLHYKNMLQAFNEDSTISVLAYYLPAKRDQANALVEKERVVFEFYLVSYQPLLESSSGSNGGEVHAQERLEQVQTSTMDCDQLWVLALKMLQLFEDTLVHSYPSLRYDRYSQCPDCLKYSFVGEWLTPKELQKSKAKTCANCKKQIEYIYLVKPSIGKNPTLDLKKLQSRLENLARLYSNGASVSIKTDAKSSKSRSKLPSISST